MWQPLTRGLEGWSRAQGTGWAAIDPEKYSRTVRNQVRQQVRHMCLGSNCLGSCLSSTYFILIHYLKIFTYLLYRRGEGPE